EARRLFAKLSASQIHVAIPLLLREHTAKPEVIGSCVGLALASSACDITGAILIRAEKRSATLDAFAHAGLTGIETIGGSGRIHRNVSRRREALIIIGTVPVGGPLPHVARHIEKSV